MLSTFLVPSFVVPGVYFSVVLDQVSADGWVSTLGRDE